MKDVILNHASRAIRYVSEVVSETSKEGGYHTEQQFKKIKRSLKNARNELDSLGRVCINGDGLMDRFETIIKLTEQRDDAFDELKRILDKYEQLSIRFSAVMNGNVLESDKYLIEGQYKGITYARNRVNEILNK